MNLLLTLKHVQVHRRDLERTKNSELDKRKRKYWSDEERVIVVKRLGHIRIHFREPCMYRRNMIL